MAVEFMVGATVFALIDLVLAVVVLYTMWSLVKKLWQLLTAEQYHARNIRTELVVIGLVLAYVMLYPSSAQPKLSIDVGPNRQLQEYQKGKDVDVISQPPRTETLEGFTPLKK